MTTSFLPEGRLLGTAENLAACATAEALAQAMARQTVLEGPALLCDENHDLTVRLGDFTGRIPRAETALGIAEGSTRDIAILSRVGKPVSFTVIGLEQTGGEVLPLLPLRDCADGVDLTQIHLSCAVFDIGNNDLIVDHGLGVGHTAHLREPALDRGP